MLYSRKLNFVLSDKYPRSSVCMTDSIIFLRYFCYYLKFLLYRAIGFSNNMIIIFSEQEYHKYKKKTLIFQCDNHVNWILFESLYGRRQFNVLPKSWRSQGWKQWATKFLLPTTVMGKSALIFPKIWVPTIYLFVPSFINLRKNLYICTQTLQFRLYILLKYDFYDIFILKIRRA